MARVSARDHPGLHTWNQELDYRVHMHCIVSGGELTSDGKIRKSTGKFLVQGQIYGGAFFPLQKRLPCFFLFLRKTAQSLPLGRMENWLYEKDWCPYIKETFHGFGNAIEYLGRYTHRIAISNNRILFVTEDQVTISAKGKKPGEPKRQISLKNTESSVVT